MWDLPGPGLEPVSPALAGGFLTTAPPGKSRCWWMFKTTYNIVKSLRIHGIIYCCYSEAKGMGRGKNCSESQGILSQFSLKIDVGQFLPHGTLLRRGLD